METQIGAKGKIQNKVQNGVPKKLKKKLPRKLLHQNTDQKRTLAGKVPRDFIAFFVSFVFQAALSLIDGCARILGDFGKGFNHLHCHGPGFACTYDSSVKFGYRGSFGCGACDENFIGCVKVK